jgi:hypothetical protein
LIAAVNSTSPTSVRADYGWFESIRSSDGANGRRARPAPHRRFSERQAGQHAAPAAPQIDQLVVVEWFGLPPQGQSRCPLGPGDGLATTTSQAACATGYSANWRLAEDFSRQVMARL